MSNFAAFKKAILVECYTHNPHHAAEQLGGLTPLTQQHTLLWPVPTRICCHLTC